MTTRKIEIEIGDVFKPKPENRLYHGVTLKVTGIRFSDQPEDEHRIEIISSLGEPDSFWRQSLWRDFEKVSE